MIRLIVVLLAFVAPLSALAQEALPRPAAKAKQAAPKPGAAQPAEPAASGSCIGVISRVGDLSVQRVGIMVFGNELRKVPISAWGLDELVVARVRAAAGPRVAVRKIAYPKDAFASVGQPERALYRDLQTELVRIAQGIAQGSGCERYVLVTEGGSRFGNTNQSVSGSGILNYGFQGLDRTYVFALTSIHVLDGRTFAVLKRGIGGGPPGLFSSFTTEGDIRGPNRRLERGFAWPPSPDAITGLRDQIRGLLAEGLDKALPALLAP